LLKRNDFAMTDQTPPLLPELEAWAIVSPDQIGPPCSAGKGQAQRLVARTGGSHLEVIYDRHLDDAGTAPVVLAEKINTLVMRGDPDVLTRGSVARISLTAEKGP